MQVLIRFLPGVLLLSVCCLRAAAGAPFEQRMAFLKQQVEESLTLFEKELAKSDTRLEARQFSTYAHWMLALDKDAGKAAGALKRVMSLQEMNPNSPRYGEFSAVEGPDSGNPERERAVSESSVVTEFTTLPIAQVLLRYGDKLPTELKDELTERLKPALAAIRGRKIPPDAGNVFLLNATNLLLIGDIVGDDRAIAEAESRIDQFIGVTRSRGIAEYVAPNYTAVQLSCLLVAHNYTRQPDARRLIEPLLKYIWSIIAANTLSGRGMLGGPHSRDHDFAFGLGATDSYLLLEGLREAAPVNTPFSEGLRAYVNYLERCWRPDESILALSTSTPGRVVRMKWGGTTGQDRYLYVTEQYAIGSSSATASPVDKKLTVEFPTPKPMPVVTVICDPFDAPYGRVRASTGQLIRPFHLREHIAAVQEKDSVLALLNLRPDLRLGKWTSIGTNIIIPANADAIVLDGKPVQLGKSFEQPVTTQSTVMVRVGGGAAAVRIFAADGMVNQSPAMFLKYDGNPMGMARLVAYHYRQQGQNVVRLPDEPVRAGVMIFAAKCVTQEDASALLARAAAAKIEHGMSGKVWQAKLVDGQTTLEAALDLQTGNIVSRRVNGVDYETAVFKVNDSDLTTGLLGW